MKILVLSHISDLVGGAERSMLDVFDSWAANYDISPEFILRLPVKGLAGELKKRGWKYHALDYTFWSDGNPPTKQDDIYHNWRRNVKAVSDIEAIIKKVKPDIVMTNSLVCPWAALAAYKQQTPHVWFIREYGDLDHGRTFEIGRQKTLSDVGNLSDLVITISESLAKHLGQYIEKSKITVLYNPFKVDEIIARTAKKATSPFRFKNSLKVIMTANLAMGKGQAEAIEAVGLLNQQGHSVELAIRNTGEAELLLRINKLVKKYKLEKKVHLESFKPDWFPYINCADIAIMASRMEGFGRVTFEYLVAGKPVVGADSGATPEMIKNGVNGYLFKPGNIESLAEGLANYAKHPELIKKHGEASKQQAKDMMRGAHNIDAAYEKVIATLKARKPHAKPAINMLQHWDDYAKTARPPVSAGADSLKTRLRRKLRRYAKAGYVRVRTVKARVTGK